VMHLEILISVVLSIYIYIYIYIYTYYREPTLLVLFRYFTSAYT